MINKHGGNIYQYDRQMVDFSANLNPAGMPDAVKQAVIDSLPYCESYPDPFQTGLRQTISRFHGVDPSRICCGNGAADIIFRSVLALRPKRALIIEPAFSEYGEALQLVGCEIQEYVMTEADEFRLDERVLPVIEQGGFDMVFLCTPANPTGVLTDRRLVVAIAERCSRTGARLVLDECFMEFIIGEEEYSVMDLIERLPNVIILKSFTKYFAMAGLRLGYCVCGSEEDADQIASCMQAWPVSTTASAAGIAALKSFEDPDEVKVFIALQRQRLMSGLRELGFRVFGSQANYVFFRSPIRLDEPLLERGIMIRNCSNYAGLGEGYYRAAVRTVEENGYLLSVLDEIISSRQ